ncbi:MAG: SET domain-containing protein [Flavobacteriales bacterium]
MALVIKTSRLPGAGKGLFTDKLILKDEKIVEYRGEIISWKEYERRVSQNRDGYLLYINKNRCIDAYDNPQYKARYANDAAGISRVKGLKNNAVYEIHGNRGYIVAKRDIQPGEEIFVSYSKEYWDCIRYNIKNKLYDKSALDKVN